LSGPEAARAIGISPSTLHAWIAKGRLIGWKTTKRGVKVPQDQILGPGRIVKGIPELLEIIEDPELAWAFLRQKWPFADDVARPIDKLRAGALKEVLDAAPSFGNSFT